MKKGIIDTERFGECLNEFVQAVREKQENRDLPVSFKKGYIDDQENYKRNIYTDANDSLKLLKYEKHGELCKWFMDSANSNNLVDWRNSLYVQEIFEKFPVESERFLHKMYIEQSEDEKLLFEEATRLFGRRYPIISYIFFLKDMNKYLPVRPEKFKERFKILEIDDGCLHSCTWENYQTFCNIIGKVQELLNASGYFPEKVELIDAHSFVWMMWLLEEPEKSIDIRRDTENRKSIVCDSEGRLKKYYGTRYERSRKNRDAAIAEHGYKCMVCGFDFEAMYGELGKNYIEVHHKEPLYVHNGTVKKINPKTDLVCLCSNCHSMIHRKKGEPMSVEELKALYDERKSRGRTVL